MTSRRDKDDVDVVAREDDRNGGTKKKQQHQPVKASKTSSKASKTTMLRQLEESHNKLVKMKKRHVSSSAESLDGPAWETTFNHEGKRPSKMRADPPDQPPSPRELKYWRQHFDEKHMADGGNSRKRKDQKTKRCNFQTPPDVRLFTKHQPIVNVESLSSIAIAYKSNIAAYCGNKPILKNVDRKVPPQSPQPSSPLSMTTNDDDDDDEDNHQSQLVSADDIVIVVESPKPKLDDDDFQLPSSSSPKNKKRKRSQTSLHSSSSQTSHNNPIDEDVSILLLPPSSDVSPPAPQSSAISKKISTTATTTYLDDFSDINSDNTSLSSETSEPSQLISFIRESTELWNSARRKHESINLKIRSLQKSLDLLCGQRSKHVDSINNILPALHTLSSSVDHHNYELSLNTDYESIAEAMSFVVKISDSTKSVSQSMESLLELIKSSNDIELQIGRLKIELSECERVVHKSKGVVDQFVETARFTKRILREALVD